MDGSFEYKDTTTDTSDSGEWWIQEDKIVFQGKGKISQKCNISPNLKIYKEEFLQKMNPENHQIIFEWKSFSITGDKKNRSNIFWYRID